MKALTLVFMISLMTVEAMAAAGGHGHHDGIPKAVWWQLFNVTILLGGLIYFAGPGIKKAFRERKDQYLAAANRARALREQAELENKDIKDRLNTVERTAKDSLQRAEADAVAMKKQMILDAEDLSKRIRSEAARSAQNENEKARREIRTAMVSEATTVARQELQKNLNSDSHRALNGDFLNKIQAANV